MQEKFYAHIRRNELTGEEEGQTVAEHLRGTAGYAQAALADVGLATTAYLAGLIHDMGKFRMAFQAYLLKAARGETVVRGSVNHTFAAVRYLLERYHSAEKLGPYAPFTAELLAYAVGAHHGQFDCVDKEHHSGFVHRLEKTGIDYEEVKENFFNQCAAEEELDRLFEQAMKEVQRTFERFMEKAKFSATPDKQQDEIAFCFGLLARLLLSAVEEGDRWDTAEFMDGKVSPKARDNVERKQLWGELLRRVEKQLECLPCETPVQLARRRISQQCGKFGERQGGIFRLNVPTGGGKTLSSLRFALAHGEQRGKSRIIFVSPLLTILEQNAKEIRKYIADDTLILEHHSNVVRPQEAQEELNHLELLMETWDAPIILTTLVQVLNTLFDGRGSCIRRFHALCNSILIVDEVQTVPGKLLSLFHLAIAFLAGYCGATVVLCSATQPCSQAAEHPIPLPTEDMVPYDSELWKVFERTRIQNAGVKTMYEIPQVAAEMLENTDSLLIVCNKKAQAEQLYASLEEEYLKFHLSAAMCVAHREKVLKELKQALEKSIPGRKVVCVSTQVIEAGVDISFGGVIRFAAGMDSIVQSAGRCNRNGERTGLAEVRIVTCAGENLTKLADIQRAKAATLQLLSDYAQTPEKYGSTLTSDQAIEHYYEVLYQKEMPVGQQDGPVEAGGHKTTLLELLARNRSFCDLDFSNECEPFLFCQAFKTAGERFSVFEGKEEGILVPYGDGKELIAALCGIDVQYDYKKLEKLLEKAKRYTVSLYEWQKQKLEREGAPISLCDGAILALQEGYYDENVGLKLQKGTLNFLGA